MKNEKLYDALVNIDENYLKEAEAAEKSQISAGRLAAVAASVLAFALVLSVVMFSLSIFRQNDNKTGSDSGIPLVQYNGRTVTVSDSEDASSKPLVYGFNAVISVPERIDNGSPFPIELALGVNHYNVDNKTAVSDFIYYWSIACYKYEDKDFYPYRKTDDSFCVSDGRGSYREEFDFERQKNEFLISEENEHNDLNYIYAADELPFHITLPAKLENAEDGKKGVIVVIYGESSEHASQGKVFRFYYYSNSGYTGFGSTILEAYNNSFGIAESGPVTFTLDEIADLIDRADNIEIVFLTGDLQSKAGCYLYIDPDEHITDPAMPVKECYFGAAYFVYCSKADFIAAFKDQYNGDSVSVVTIDGINPLAYKNQE
ncbi:MAG: hypothetical protein J5950_03280 [Clostridia bacterium]|nr:hypothetical protein [Clostridia bacterium]MBR5721838.1 hypothetical protein [Clostridia bacterium]